MFMDCQKLSLNGLPGKVAKMPLHGKIVVIKRSGGDGTEFPLTATCLFGRKPDCDIRIQLPQVSKEHCRIDFNENKEVILTNLSSVNPTRVNGEALQQSDRLKHGDVITIIDRSFRFEYPPEPTPKKRSSIGGKTETLKVLQDQQDGDTVATETVDKRISEVSTDPHLKDGTNHGNIQRSLEKTVELEPKEDSSLLQSKTASPFSDLYQMIKKSLDVKTPQKSSASLLQTPTSRFCTPKPGSVRKNVGKSVVSTEDSSTLKKDEAKGEAENISSGTPKSVKKQRRSFQAPSTEMESVASSPQKINHATPQRFTVGEVIEQVSPQTPKSPMRRRSKEAKAAQPAVTKEQEEQAMTSPKREHLRKASPRNSGKVETVKETFKKRKSGELAPDLPVQQMKKKRVSFGGHLCPELFDKRLPPDSPLRKGASPRRSLSLLKPKQSLLRRASVIGLLQEMDSPNVQSPAKRRTPSPKKSTAAINSPKAATPTKKSPKSKTPSPKAATPAKKSPKSKTPSPKAATPAKKSPKSKTPSPKAETPAKKSPKSKTPSPKAETPAKKSPKSKTPSPKAETPAKKSAESKSPSLARGRSPSKNQVETPKASKEPKIQRSSLTPGVQTPSVQGRFSVSRISTPSPVAEDVVPDLVPLVTVTPKLPLRRKSNSQTPNLAKSAVKLMHRRSGISRASMKAKSSWADTVKFGKPKAQVAAPAQKTVAKKTTKMVVSKPQTPARRLKGHVSTGHANSPVTIVVGRAHKQQVIHPIGAAPRLVTNIALLKKNMKMDEDLTGVSEMFKTPLNERKRRSVFKENSTMKTPVGGLGTSVVEPSVLNTPEEPGEMMVSPLNVSSAVKDGRYNSEAVQRLLNGDQESSFVADPNPATETLSDDSSEQQCADLKTSVTTPKQKPELPERLTGVKRIMKTPRRKAEPVEDLRGRLLKTPKQKLEAQECLTGVKRIMKTPRQKSEPIEDLRGKILKTPKQKPEQQECLTGVKRIMQTPQQEAEPLKDLHGEHLETPTALEAGDAGFEGVEELVATPAQMQKSGDLCEKTDMKTPDVKSSPPVCLTGIKRIMKTPKERSTPVEDMVGVKRLLKTPREKSEPVEENLGIKRLMKSPRLRGNAAVEDFEGLQELLEEPVADPAGQPETNEVEDQMPLDSNEDVAKELDFAHEEPRDDVPSDVADNIDMEKADANDVVVDDHLEEVPSGQNNTESSSSSSSDAMETVSRAAVDENLRVGPVDENVIEEQPKVETAATDPEPEKKPVRGRRPKAAEDSAEPTVAAPVRGRKGKKTEAAAPPAARQTTRSRNTKTTESSDTELTMEKSSPLPSKVALKPKRGRNAKKASDDLAEMAQEAATETEMVPEAEGEQSPSVDVEHEAPDGAAPLEKAVLKPKRGRNTKQAEKSVAAQQDVPCSHSEAVPQADIAQEAETNEVSNQPSGSDEHKSPNAMETVPREPETEGLPEVETAVDVVTQKSVRGRRKKVLEAENKQEERSKEPVVSAPVRGRRGKKTEATAPPAARKTPRSRNAKSQENTSDLPEMEPEKAVETEIPTGAVADQTSPAKTHQEDDSAPPALEAVVKPVRGRKTKQTPVEPPQTENNEVTHDEQKPIPSLGKSRRGRKTKPDTVEQHEVAEDTVTVETEQPPVRAKRGRNAKREEDKLENDVKTSSIETTASQEPIKKLRRTRNTEQDHGEPTEVQTVEMVASDEAESPHLAEPVKINEQAAVALKSRRGVRKAKQDTESESTEAPAVNSTDKPRRGRRGKQASEEVGVSAVVPEENPHHELQAEEKTNDAEPQVAAVKPSRARGVKTSVKNEVSQVIPAKRARRGAALPHDETNAESTVVVSASSSVEPAKRGRRAAAKSTTDDAVVTIDQADPNAVVEDTKMSKRSVKWRADLEVFEIPKVTPVKAVRGRKSKLEDQVDAESKNVSKDANKTEEKELSGKVVEAQPVKRARRGAKVTDVTANEAESTSTLKGVDAEMKPKTRRGRSAKK